MKAPMKKMPKLGFGLMRLPQIDGEIDLPQVCEMVDAYMNQGLNYFDSAYVYHGGQSEVVMRKAIVQRYPRDSFYLATKLPAWEMTCKEDCDRIFNEQLQRAGVDYFDFYLLHSLSDGKNYDNYVKYDCFRWAMQKKAEGKIKYFGFSFHGTSELLEQVVDEHPEIDFVQIQLNYADWANPIVGSARNYEILRSRGIPIVVMEPIKGGTLAEPGLLPAECAQEMKAARPDASLASWALRFVASLEGVATVLSGMSAREQMEDNLRTFRNFQKLDVQETAIIDRAIQKITNADFIQCTSCRYCCKGCPAGINIPVLFRAMNTTRINPDDRRPYVFYRETTAVSGKADSCLECGQCESVCPQHLPIMELLKEAAVTLNKQV